MRNVSRGYMVPPLRIERAVGGEHDLIAREEFQAGLGRRLQRSEAAVSGHCRRMSSASRESGGGSDGRAAEDHRGLRPLTGEECIVETVLEIIGGATVIEDGIERLIGPDDIHGVLYHLREACLTTQRFRARQSKQAMRAIKQLSTALRRANQPKGGLPEDIRLVLGLRTA